MQEKMLWSNAMRENLFANCHPVVLFAYFLSVVLITMLTAHPVVIGISFLAGFSYRFFFPERKRFLKEQIFLGIPLFLLIVVFNAAFNHYGVTPLYYLKTGAITLEAILYGVVAGMMLWSALIWFSVVNFVMTTDKFIDIFGRLFPTFSLFLSMVFRFVPHFRKRFLIIREGQAGIGKDISDEHFLGKFKAGVAEISMLLSWALESAVQTVNSMKSRGYGTGKRTRYTIYNCYVSDYIIAGIGLLFLIGSMTGFMQGAGKSQYDPVIQIGGFPLSCFSVVTYLFWLCFCFYPVFVSCYGIGLANACMEPKVDMKRR